MVSPGSTYRSWSTEKVSVFVPVTAAVPEVVASTKSKYRVANPHGADCKSQSRVGTYHVRNARATAVWSVSTLLMV
jgi:hypothetical protein